MIDRLPFWVLTNNHPAFDDVESLTAIEMVARLYGKTNELIENYNEFVKNVDNKIALQDDKIADTIEYIKDHLEEYETALFEQALAEGRIGAELNVNYDAETENLVFSIVATGGE